MSFDYPGGGNYHSSTDDLYYESHWGDPGYLHHAAMARLAGITALRLANADILPFQYSGYAEQVSGYLERLNARQRALYGEVVVSFDREMAQAGDWQAAASQLESQNEAILAANPSIPASLLKTTAFTNQQIIQQEHDLTQPRGLPGRPWFRHMIYAPGLYTGYGVQYLSAMEDAIIAGDWAMVRAYQALLFNSLVTATRTATSALRAER